MCTQKKDRLIYRQSNQTVVSGSPLFNLLNERKLLQYFGDGAVEFHSGNWRGYTCEWTIADGELYLTTFRSRSMRLHKTAQIFGTEPIYDLTEERVQEIAKSKEERALREVNREEVEEYLTPEEKKKRIKSLIEEIYRKMDEPEVVPIPREMSPEKLDELKKELDEARVRVRNIRLFYPDDTTQVKADWFSGVIVAYDRRAQDEEDLNGWEFTFKEGELVEEKKRYVWSPRSLKDYIED
ncbi:MAG: hypothetical protein Q7U00_08425 [Sulfurimonas sp.]|nr:hypothetical protein [Sulfurimonas sp.]